MDLNLGQGTWNQMFTTLGSAVRIWHWLNLYLKFKAQGIRPQGESWGKWFADADSIDEPGSTLIEYNDVSNKLSGWSLESPRLGLETDINGKIYVSIVAGTPNTVDLYRDSGRTQKVGTGTVTGTGKIDIAPTADEYQIAGTVELLVASNDTTIELLFRPDWKWGLLTAIDTTSDQGSEMLTKLFAQLDEMVDDIDGMIEDWEEVIETEIIMTYFKKRMNSASSVALDVNEVQNNGTVTRTYSGVLAELADNMADDTTPQTIRKILQDSQVVSVDGDNTGQGTIAITVDEHAQRGSITLECDDETIGSETFAITFRPREFLRYDDSTGVYSAQVKKTYIDNGIGVASLVISRTITETNDGQGVFSDWTFSGETEDNTDDGKLYIKYYTATDTCEVYSDSARTYLVASGTGTGAVTLAEQNSSGLSGSVTLAHQALDDFDVIVDLQVFKIGDKFQIRFKNEASGYFQKFFSDVYNFSLPSHATYDSETISDAYARRG